MGTLTFPDTNDSNFYESSYNSYNYILSYNLSYDDLYNICSDIKRTDSYISSYKYYSCQLRSTGSSLDIYVSGWNDNINGSQFSNLSTTSSNTQAFNLSYSSGAYVSYQIYRDKSYELKSYSSSTTTFLTGFYYDYDSNYNIISSRDNFSTLEGYFYTNIDYWEDNKFLNLVFTPQRSFYFNYDNKLYNNQNGNKFSIYDFGYKSFTDFVNNGIVNYLSPTYEYTSTLLDNGNVKLDFTFNNYNDSNIYGFTITNEVSGEEYGIENPFSSIFPNIIPFGSSYSIEVPYDTYIYITLAKYEKYEDSELYYRTEIYTDTIDINNVVFSNPQDSYFQLLYFSQNNLTGIFKNTPSDSTCYFVRSNNLDVESEVSCSEQVSVDVNFNGYVKFYVKQKDNIIYSRNINVLGNSNSFLPYIIYSVDKQDFYSVITWSVANQNFDSNMKFRYSLDNGKTFTSWTLIEKSTNFNINIFENSYVIIEISNSDNSTIYDSKSISVVVDISNIKDLNNTSNNFINKFISIFSVNSDILKYVNIFWNTIKTSKLYLVIFIPFLGALICGIIYLIRRD